MLLPIAEDFLALTEKKKRHENKGIYSFVWNGRSGLQFLVTCYFVEFERNFSQTIDLMIDKKAFNSIPNCLDFEGHKLANILSGRRPAC